MEAARDCVMGVFAGQHAEFVMGMTGRERRVARHHQRGKIRIRAAIHHRRHGVMRIAGKSLHPGQYPAFHRDRIGPALEHRDGGVEGGGGHVGIEARKTRRRPLMAEMQRMPVIAQQRQKFVREHPAQAFRPTAVTGRRCGQHCLDPCAVECCDRDGSRMLEPVEQRRRRCHHEFFHLGRRQIERNGIDKSRTGAHAERSRRHRGAASSGVRIGW